MKKRTDAVTKCETVSRTEIRRARCVFQGVSRLEDAFVFAERGTEGRSSGVLVPREGSGTSGFLAN